MTAEFNRRLLKKTVFLTAVSGLVLTLLLTFAAASPAAADEEENSVSFISNLVPVENYLGPFSNSYYAISGYDKYLNYDLYDEVEYFSLLILYYTSTDSKEAITDIIIDNSGGERQATIEVDGITYYALYGSEYDEEASQFYHQQCMDINKHNGGKSVYLYWTKDTRAGDPITALTITKGSSELADWNTICNTSGEAANLCAGAQCSAKYLHCQQAAIENTDLSSVASVFAEGNLLFILIGAVLLSGVLLLVGLKRKKSQL